MIGRVMRDHYVLVDGKVVPERGYQHHWV
jgi:hypothetical protein